MIEIIDKREEGKLERIGQIVKSWRIYDDDDRNSKYDKDFNARVVLAEIQRIVEERK